MATRETGPEGDEGLGELIGRLAEDAKAYGQAELDYYHMLARGKLREARAGLWWGALAAGLAIATAVALVMGLLLTIATLVGPGWATVIVVIGFALVAALMGRLAWLHVKRVLKASK